MRLKRKLTWVMAALLCGAWTCLTWPGSSSHGHFYPYPISFHMLWLWAAGWAVIFVLALFILDKTKEK